MPSDDVDIDLKAMFMTELAAGKGRPCKLPGTGSKMHAWLLRLQQHFLRCLKRFYRTYGGFGRRVDFHHVHCDGPNQPDLLLMKVRR